MNVEENEIMSVDEINNVEIVVDLTKKCSECMLPLCYAVNEEEMRQLKLEHKNTRAYLFSGGGGMHTCKSGTSRIYDGYKQKKTNTDLLPLYTTSKMNKSFVIDCPRCHEIHAAINLCHQNNSSIQDTIIGTGMNDIEDELFFEF